MKLTELIDPGVLLGLLIISVVVTIFLQGMGYHILGGILIIANCVGFVILLFQAADLYEEQNPQELKDSKAAYVAYVETTLLNYGYTDVEVEYSMFNSPSGSHDGYSPDISATGSGDPDFMLISRLMEDLNSYQDVTNGYLFDTDWVALTYNGEKQYYEYDETTGFYYATLHTEFVLDEETGTLIPEKPIRGMGESQIYHTLMGEPTSITETDEGTSYLWVTGERDNLEAIVSDGHVSNVRKRDTYRGSQIFAEDVANK